MDAVLSQTDIVELVGSYIRLKRSGASYIALCPFHKDNHPSMHVSPQKQIYKCFSCGAGGDAIRFLCDYKRIPFKEALSFLANKANITLTFKEPTLEEQRITKQRTTIAGLLKRTQTHYQQMFYETTEASVARQYLLDRGFDQECIRYYGVGYSLGLPNLSVDASLWEQSGLKVRSSHGLYERFRGRLTFPIKNAMGQVVGFGARSLDGSKPKYLNSSESLWFQKRDLLFGLQEALKTREKRIFVVEGYTDVLACYQAGVPNVVASLGTALSDSHIKLLFRYFEEIVLVFDGDEAGQNAAKRGVEIALSHIRDGLNLRLANLPEGLDPAELLKRKEIQELRSLLHSSMDVSEYLLQKHTPLGENPTPSKRAHYLNTMLSLLDVMPPSHYRTFLLDDIYHRVGKEPPKPLSLSQEKEEVETPLVLKHTLSLKKEKHSYALDSLVCHLLLNNSEFFDEKVLSQALEDLSLIQAPLGHEKQRKLTTDILDASLAILKDGHEKVLLAFLFGRLETQHQAILPMIEIDSKEQSMPTLRLEAFLSELRFEDEKIKQEANQMEDGFEGILLPNMEEWNEVVSQGAIDKFEAMLGQVRWHEGSHLRLKRRLLEAIASHVKILDLESSHQARLLDSLTGLQKLTHKKKDS